MKRCVGFMAMALLGGCTIPEKLSTIGQPPSLTHIQDPTKLPYYQPVQMPMPMASEHVRHGNSLWEPGSRAFFKDQRASKVGDVVTVLVNIDQQESIEMTPTMNRQNKSTSTVTNVMGFERKAEKLFPRKQHEDGKANPNWLDVNSNPSLSGKAKYDVKDKMQFKVAAYVLQVLPNGNMVVQGRQEMRLINELREVLVKGIVRKEDISSANTIVGDKIAELRISYGGRGELTDMQAFPIGQQVVNKIMPF
jgi:flagellar L-ring protein precursor FlgH